jgi:hypothetical protein
MTPRYNAEYPYPDYIQVSLAPINQWWIAKTIILEVEIPEGIKYNLWRAPILWRKVIKFL